MQVKKQQLEPDMEQWNGSKLGKEYVKYFYPAYLKLHAEYIRWNARLDESQVGIKIARRNINNLIYRHDTTLMAESKESLESLLMRVKEESEEGSLEILIKKPKIMASGSIN